MVDAFAIAAVALGLRMAAQHSPSRQLLTRMLPFAAAAAVVTCGWAALTQSGQPFVLLAAMATCVAAYDFGLETACVITATGSSPSTLEGSPTGSMPGVSSGCRCS